MGWKCQDNRKSAAYYNSTLSCMDPPVSDLASNLGWRRYWETWLVYFDHEGHTTSDASLAQKADYAMRHGCSVITTFNLSALLCADSSVFHSLGSYCPEACDCAGN